MQPATKKEQSVQKVGVNELTAILQSLCRKSSATKERHNAQYKTYHTQLKLWKAWLKEVYLKNIDNPPHANCNSFIAQAYKT